MRTLLTVLPLLALVGCNEAEPPTPGEFAPSAGAEVIHTVNGHEITSDMKDTLLRQMPDQMRQQLEASGQMGRLDDQLIIGELLYREALNRKLQDDPATQQLLAMTARTVLADAALEKVMEERLTDEAVQKAYDDRAVQYARKQAKVRVIAVQTDDEAAAVKARLDKGDAFATVAAEMSKDPRTASKGGELGWMSERDITPEFREQIFGAAAGSVIGPLSAGGGQVFFAVEESRDKVPLEEVRESLEEELKNTMREEYFEELKKSATISSGSDAAGGATIVPPDPAAAPAKDDGHGHPEGQGH